MYPSTHQQPGLGVGVGGGNLTRYGSAPGSLLSTLVDSVIGTTAEDELSGAVGSDALMGRYFSGDSSSLTSESSCKATVSPHHHQQQLKEGPRRNEPQVSSGLAGTGAGTLERSYGFNQMGSIAGGGDFVTPGNFRAGTGTGIGSSPLIRHSSSPAGFFNHLSLDNDFAVKRGLGPYSLHRGSDGRGITNARLKSQLSFTRQDSLPQISEVSENIADGSSSDDGQHNVGGHSYASAGTFPMGSWDNSRTIMFSTPPSKRAKDINGDIAAALSSMDSDSQFSLPSTSLEMSTFEKLLQMQQDSVPCKIRAKRGCATHPRSIAERERRSRISRKMRKLQELVPNMDKQTSNADMLDLAIQYIKNLQNEVQKLNKDMESCSCGSKKAL